jgi:hypothetical protein
LELFVPSIYLPNQIIIMNGDSRQEKNVHCHNGGKNRIKIKFQFVAELTRSAAWFASPKKKEIKQIYWQQFRFQSVISHYLSLSFRRLNCHSLAQIRTKLSRRHIKVCADYLDGYSRHQALGIYTLTLRCVYIELGMHRRPTHNDKDEDCKWNIIARLIASTLEGFLSSFDLTFFFFIHFKVAALFCLLWGFLF